MVLDFRKIKEKGLSARLIWDLFMILIAVINLLMILFDFTYFWGRPHYKVFAPQLVQFYDPYKGVGENPEFRSYLDLARKYFHDTTTGNAGEAGTEPQELANLDEAARDENQVRLREELARMSKDIGDAYQGFFLETGQSEMIRTMSYKMHAAIPEEFSLISTRQYRLQDTGPAFWKTASMEDQKRIFEQSIEPTFQQLYYRHRGPGGEFVDRFIYLDAPFLILFLLEFLGRWILSVRRKENPRWWLFPIYNWYDILGLIPFAYFRIFRLVRIVSIYIRLHRSELTTVGQDLFSRTFKRYSEILTEELSDRVAIRILTEIQSEIRVGASIKIVLGSLREKREPLKQVIIETLQNFGTDLPALDDTRRLLEASLEKAARNVPSLRLVPDFIKETLTREIGLAVFDAINESMIGAWQDERGEQLISEAVDFALEEMSAPESGRKLDELSREIAIDVIENLKKSVAVKQWAREEARKEPPAAD